MQNAANWRFRGPITNLISTRPESGGQDRSFQLIVIGVITGEGGGGRRLDRGEKGEGRNGMVALCHIYCPRGSQLRRANGNTFALTTTSPKFPPTFFYFMHSTILGRKDKISLLSSFRCMHLIRIKGQERRVSKAVSLELHNSGIHRVKNVRG